MAVKIKTFEAPIHADLDAAVNGLLSTLLLKQLMDVHIWCEGAGSAMHTKWYAYVIYEE